jgi:hypothetical protein
MSAAATAAGYLYASGRLRGRNDRGRDEHGHDQHGHHHEPVHPEHEQRPAQKPRRQVKVAVYQPEPQPGTAERPKKTPKIEYRQRRWRPE